MLNKAPIDGLTLLPGIGQIIAERIISRRNLTGSFKSVDELLKVKGIGKIKLNKIRPYIIIGDMNENAKN
ncbi:MAG: helix-hairpin-helix domain-containing protein [Candidatus Marinimicrobia bacterium]|nr:helix-hairpin-helix domain-containing protein [Candidatus Neomarinimicrobiota bacterium]